jgi:hypothetical protein
MALERLTLVRMAGVQAEDLVRTEALHAVDRLAREAMTGHAMLRQWGNQLAGDDLILADELRFFTDAARLGKGEILADAVSNFCRR